ncbi:MAG: tetratricopeptide repeat protein [Fimbriimonadaceae bacterium]|nr:tetratricopeptide repeat protein [Fimbriimonadaceae bacterium]QYK56974.1 MAG: tetratricopeptide repeat protein [Fimbriimonadaceae bacterium]
MRPHLSPHGLWKRAGALMVLPFVVASLEAGAQEPPQPEDRSEAIYQRAAGRMEELNDAWFRDGEFPRINQSLRFLVEADPRDEERASDLIWMLGNVEERTEAFAYAIRFKNANPDYADAAYYEAQLWFNAKAYTRVVPLLEPALRMTPPPHVNALRFLAHSYNRLGYYEDAVRVWDMVVHRNPNDGAAKKNRADILKKWRG